MASDEPKLDIVDLLYDDELDETTRRAARDDVEADPQERAELEDFEQMLSAIRDVELDQEVPSSVHDSIMEAARAKAAESTSQKARTTSRQPKAAPSEPSLWSRMHSSGVSQLVMAASVVLVAGFIFVKISGDSVESAKFSAAHDAVSSEVTFGESNPKYSEAASEPQPAEQLEREEVVGDEPVAARKDLADDELVEEDRAKGDLAAAEEGNADPVEAEESALGELARVDRDREPTTRRSRAPSRKRRAKSREPTKAKKGESLDLLDSMGKSESSRYAKPSTDDDSKADVLASADEADDKAPAAPDERKAESSISDISDLGNLGESSASSGSASSSSGAEAEASSQGRGSSTKSAADEDSGAGVARMESSYAAQNYDAVVDQADRFLAQSDGDAPETARVLELKALALTRQGEYTDADRVYAQLQRDFPSYKSDDVARERRELAEERNRAQKRRARPTEKSEDRYMDDVEADEAAEPVESTIEAY
jgi:hypothetical protein